MDARTGLELRKQASSNLTEQESKCDGSLLQAQGFMLAIYMWLNICMHIFLVSFLASTPLVTSYRLVHSHVLLHVNEVSSKRHHEGESKIGRQLGRANVSSTGLYKEITQGREATMKMG
eukprot:1146622-Pelagomonas_calceolata.AAC.7